MNGRPKLLNWVILALLMALAGVSVLIGIQIWTNPPAALLDPSIPNEQMLIDRGLSGVPLQDQPTQPATVDRVLVNEVATYVQYHTSGPINPGANVLLTLSDDRGHIIDRGAQLIARPPSKALPLPAWFPWHPPVIQRYVAVLKPLPATAHAAILRFPLVSEIVLIPLRLQALKWQPTIRPHNSLPTPTPA